MPPRGGEHWDETAAQVQVKGNACMDQTRTFSIRQRHREAEVAMHCLKTHALSCTCPSRDTSIRVNLLHQDPHKCYVLHQTTSQAQGVVRVHHAFNSAVMLREIHSLLSATRTADMRGTVSQCCWERTHAPHRRQRQPALLPVVAPCLRDERAAAAGRRAALPAQAKRSFVFRTRVWLRLARPAGCRGKTQRAASVHFELPPGHQRMRCARRRDFHLH